MRMLDRRAALAQAGFSLVEVVVALALLGVVATAALGFFVRGIANDVDIQRREVAVSLANAAMEQVRAVDPVWTQPSVSSTASTQTRGLVAGRDAASVRTAWDSATFPAKDRMVPASDTSATALSTRAIPLTSGPTTISGQSYTTSIFIGTCGRPRNVTTADCTAGQTPATAVFLQRVVVEVRWSPANGRCGSDGCVYRVSSLVDPNSDATWLASS